jgi:superfamily II DNA or RNA helicase
MISVFEDLVQENKLKVDIDKYIDTYYKKYSKDKKNYQKSEDYYDYIYSEYSIILKIEPSISLLEEIESLTIEEPTKYSFDTQTSINTLFMKCCLLESLKRVIEDKSNTDKDLLKKCKSYKTNHKFKYYPDINEYNDYNHFIRAMSLRKEFGIHHIPKNKRDSCKKELFELSPHQLFLKNLLSNNTPYNGILIFHGVGVGKTCSGVSIAENFKDSDNRVIILAPEKIQSGWRKTIYDPLKEDNQCTSNEYNYEEDKYEKNKEKMAKKRIKEFYEMHGYLSFANSVKNYLQDNLRNISEKNILERKIREIELIKEKYSNKVLIIDEVHNIRSDDAISKDRDTILFIEKVIKHSDNLRLVLLTANPMFNQPEEIIWILNMLLMNDKRRIIKEEITFDENNDLTEESIKLISENSKGYISYLRGENPVTFPYRLYPIEKERILKNNKLDIFGNKIEEKDRLSFLELYSSKLTREQGRRYELETKDLEEVVSIDQVTYYGKLLQISNCIYPNKSDDIEDCYGTNGLSNCFTIKTKKPVKYSYKKDITNFLDLKELGNYSCKIKSIIESINNSDGIVFIYSNYLDGGIMPLVLALEQNGYIKYDKEEVLVSDKKRPIQSYRGGPLNSTAKGEWGCALDQNSESVDYPATYSVIAGDSLKLTTDFEKELSVVSSPDNSEGKLIKIVIGSSVAAEGLDFKNIRSIHLMEPWHNLNKIEQVIGRGIRNCSHASLKEECKNITIYLHTCELDKKETIETYMYRKCESKAKQIGQVETILKDMAIDKYLFRNANLIKEEDIEEIKINPSLRSKKGKDNSFRDRPFDKPFSRTCSFLDTKPLKNKLSCDYLGKDEFEITVDKIDKMSTHTFSLKYSQPIIDTYKKYISGIFSDYYLLSFEEIVNKMKERIVNFLSDIFNHSLEQMINDKYTIELLNSKGYIKFTDNYYLFQPINNEDIFISLYYRLNQGTIDKNDYRLELDRYALINIPERQEFSWEDIDSKYEEIKNTKLKEISKEGTNSIEEILNFKNKSGEIIFNERIKYAYIIDRLRFKEKCLLLYSVLEYKLENTKIRKDQQKFMDILIEIFGSSFIYHNDDSTQYEWFKKYDENNLKKLFGGFVFFHERNEYILFRYDSKELVLCNNIQIESILYDYSLIDKNKILNQKMYGFLVHNKGIHFANQNNIVLKLKKEKDTYGKIIRTSGSSELTPANLMNFIKKEFKTDWKSIKDKEESLNDKLKLSVLIECLLRNDGKFIGGDLLWLYLN